MRISTALSIKISVIVTGLVVLIGFSVYLIASGHRASEFSKRLAERVEITEKLFLEEDSFSSAELAKMKKRFLQTLPNETEQVIEMSNPESVELLNRYTQETKNQILKQRVWEFELGDEEGRSVRFEIGGKDYVIVVTATDESGKENLQFLKFLLMVISLISFPISSLSSFLLVKRALQPISKKIDLANNINATGFHERLEVLNPINEIGEMAIAFNGLLDRLEKAFNAQKEFISNASHEMKNPLTAIIGEAEIALSKRRSPEEYEEAMTLILAESENLDSTINNMLTLSKVTALEGQISFDRFVMASFIQEVKESYNFMNADNQIGIKLEGGDTVWDLKVRGSKNLLKTVFTNIFDNACKFSDNKPVEVSIQGRGTYLIIKVIDQGIGIAPDDLAHVETVFYRGDNARGIRGSGVGLALAIKIVELHGGTLKVDSKLKEGTKITIQLPVYKRGSKF